MGKVNEVDYTALRAALLARAAELAHDSEVKDAELEALIQARREASKEAETCPACGEKIPPGDRFCSACGVGTGIS